MRKQVLIFSALAISTFAFGQKKEMKSAEKALKAGKTAEAKSALALAKPLVANAEAKIKAKYSLLDAKVNYDLAKKGADENYALAATALNEVISIEEKSGKKTYTIEARQLMSTMSADLVNGALAANEAKTYGVAAKKLYLAYQLENNQDYLYFAANSAISDKDFDSALKYYLELKEVGYTGVVTEYYATDIETGEQVKMQNKQQSDLFVKGKSHKDPVEKLSESRVPEIVKNIALIYTQKGDTENALAAIKDARAENPEDVNLILTEANLYIQQGEKDKFSELLKQAIEKDPNNPTLYFNLGVISGEQGNSDEAKGYYEKAVEIDPKHKESYLNLASLLLAQEGPIVEEMNSLGNSRADNARYDILKGKREGLYKSAVPYLEKLLKIDGKDPDALKTLMNIYGSLGDTAKFKELKDRVDALAQ